MAYVLNLSSSQAVYLENQGDQTVVTTVTQTPGQQQQASSGIHTGRWTAPPCAYQTLQGVIVQLQTERGEQYIQLQGNYTARVEGVVGLNASQQLQLQQVSHSPGSTLKPIEPMTPMQPMTPMPPMTPIEPMKPMEMRMGDMEMRMGSATSGSNTRQFCSQCGAKVKPEDRFCSNCGYRLDS